MSLDYIWGVGFSLGGWVVRVLFNGLLLCEIVLARGEVDRVVVRDETVRARAVGRRKSAWRRVAVLFTDSTVIALRRSMLGTPLASGVISAPRNTVRLHHERHGALCDHVRCQWDSGDEMRLRFRPGELRKLGAWVETQPAPMTGPLARAVDWVRSGTTYEDWRLATRIPVRVRL